MDFGLEINLVGSNSAANNGCILASETYAYFNKLRSYSSAFPINDSSPVEDDLPPSKTAKMKHNESSSAFSFVRSSPVYGRGGPFSPSQWMELEHQALIYKYITANLPIPSYLLLPIRKALESCGFSLLKPTDQPGRCGRTDGKKWRCSRAAVTDQKYCERHMNRGRHRSRKPVEGQPSRTRRNEKPKMDRCLMDVVCSDSLLNPSGGRQDREEVSWVPGPLGEVLRFHRRKEASQCSFAL